MHPVTTVVAGLIVVVTLLLGALPTVLELVVCVPLGVEARMEARLRALPGVVLEEEEENGKAARARAAWRAWCRSRGDGG